MYLGCHAFLLTGVVCIDPRGLDTHLKRSSNEPGIECKGLREINTDLGYLRVLAEGRCTGIVNHAGKGSSQAGQGQEPSQQVGEELGRQQDSEA